MAVPVERSRVFRFGVFEVDERARELRKQGSRVRLQEQPFQVLFFLLEHAGNVVTRDELRQHLWPSSVYVDFDHGLNNAIARLREALGDAAATPHYIETLPRLGYRFIYPLNGASAERRSGAPGTIDPIAPAPIRQANVSRSATARVLWMGGTIAAVVASSLLVGFWLARQRADESLGGPPSTSEPSIAVLPFISVDSDPDSEHFADGLSEEMVVKLAGVHGLRVVGRTSSFYFKGKQESLGVIAQTLKVNHILEGSVRHVGTRLRITAQLIDAGNGSHLWSDTFDRDLTDIFKVQEDIAFAVATALRLKLVEADERRVRRRGTQNADAYRLYVIATANLRGITISRDLPVAKQLFERAIALDPEFAAAYAGLARYYFHGAWTSLDDVEDGVSLGLAAAERAVALDPESSDALQARADFAMWRYRFRDDFQAYTQAHEDFRRAMELDPSNEAALFDFGRTILWQQPDLAQSLFERLVDLDPLAAAARGMAAIAMHHRGLMDAARERLQELDNRTSDKPDRRALAIYRAAMEQDSGHLDVALISMRDAAVRGGIEMPIWLWSLEMTLGGPEAPRAPLDFGDTALAKVLGESATSMMEGNCDAAFASLERHRAEFRKSRVLDLPTARLALIAGKPKEALTIISERLPDLFSGVEPVNAQNVIPALDLAAAWNGSGNRPEGRQLLGRIAVFLDGPAAPPLPLFAYQRARAYALNGESEMALQTLDRAYAAGFRTTWAIDLHPLPFLYFDPIDVDPAFATLRTDPRYLDWLSRIRSDNARQRERVSVHDAAEPAA